MPNIKNNQQQQLIMFKLFYLAALERNVIYTRNQVSK